MLLLLQHVTRSTYLSVLEPEFLTPTDFAIAMEYRVPRLKILYLSFSLQTDENLK